MVDEKFGLSDGTAGASEATQDIVNVQALRRGQRQTTLLTVTMGRFSRPRCRWQVWRASCPLYCGKASRGKLSRKYSGLVGSEIMAPPPPLLGVAVTTGQHS